MAGIQRKSVLFVADSLDNAYKYHKVLSDFEADVAAGSIQQLGRLLASKDACDLVIYEMRAGSAGELSSVERMLLEYGNASLLVIVRDDDLDTVVLPAQLRCDFVSSSASEAECAARIRLMLWPASGASSADFVTIDTMTINLATYQVEVSGVPVDLTYLEYALLAFLATHPGRTFSRDALLRRVWGFDYYGGSRTVDVHVRRVRAKLGPELSQHLETVRGVGYLWN